jgi:hypothetical protein
MRMASELFCDCVFSRSGVDGPFRGGGADMAVDGGSASPARRRPGGGESAGRAIKSVP